MSAPKTPLDYQPPPMPVSSAATAGQCVLAAIGTAIIAPVVVLFAGIGAGALVGDRSGSEGTAVTAAIIAGGIPLVGIIVLAGMLLRRRRRRGFGIGILIGLGVDLLLIGLCFGAFR